MKSLVHFLETRPPIVWAVLAYGAAVLLIGPWGDFPLNDDWGYAHLAKRLAETGQFRVNVPVAPSTVGQSLLGASFIKMLGFSHTLLRALTIALGGAVLWMLSRLLSYADVRPGVQTVALLTLAVNPLYLYLSLTFMTEIYGWGLGLCGAVLWMRARARAGGGPAAPGWTTTLGAAAIVGASFWIRQFAVAVFPALIGAYLLERVKERDLVSLRRAAPRMGIAALAFCAVVLAYLPFAASIGGLRTEMSGPLRGMLTLRPGVWLLHVGIVLVYVALLLCPLFALLRFRGIARRRAVAAGLGVALSLSATLLQILTRASEDYRHGDFLHRTFPFLGNVVHPGGVGPITLTDVYVFDRPQPRLPDALWLAVEVVAVLLAAYWIPLVANSGGGSLEKGIRREVFSFGLLLTCVSLLLVWQAYGTQVFDRYYLPCLFGVALMLATVLSTRAAPTARAALLKSSALLVPLAVFTVCGLHDYFRWNEARWRLFDEAVAQGVDPARIDGGYEVDGWVLKEPPPGAGKTACIGGRCHCDGVWWRCQDASYRIGMNVVDGYEELRRVEPSYWLAGSPLILSRRAHR